MTLDAKVQVLHTCDVPHCVNPAHLFLGNHVLNMADMYGKGRGPDVSGDRNPRAKLSGEDVVYIRKQLAQGRSYASLAVEFRVTDKLIGMIARNQIWKHLT